MRNRFLLILLAVASAGTTSDADAAPVAPGPAADASAESARSQDGLDQALSERRVFRHVLVGATINPARRYTWVLLRRARTVRLVAYCQDAKPLPRGKSTHPGMSLTGDENDETIWLAPDRASYAGTRVSDAPLTYELTADRPGCGLPSALGLTCRAAKVDVRPAGAALIPGGKRSDDTMRPAHWNPSTHKRVDVVRCDVAIAAGPDLGHLDLKHWPLAFAYGQGIEWAWENSDMIVQEGAYRYLPE